MVLRHFVALIVLWGMLAAEASAQYSTVTNPFNTINNSFFERIGVDFGFQGKNFFFQQNGFGAAVPPFGNFAPGAGATLSWRSPDGRSFFNIEASQGSRSSMVSQVPMVTLPNGVQGGVFDTTQRPFVIGVIPVVGDGGPSPLQERLQRMHGGAASGSGSGTATQLVPGAGPMRRAPAAVEEPAEAPPQKVAAEDNGAGTLSLNEIRQLRSAKQDAQAKEAESLLERGREAEEAGKPNVAKIFYQQALHKATGATREELQQRLDALKSAAAKPQ